MAAVRIRMTNLIRSATGAHAGEHSRVPMVLRRVADARIHRVFANKKRKI